MLTAIIKEYINKSVLCWLATSSAKNIPNVSPKEIFCAFGDQHLLIAHIASPKSIKNISSNSSVCVSFVDIFAQKGFKLKGQAVLVDKNHLEYDTLIKPLIKMAGDSFPIISIIKIKIDSAKPILAPSYIMFPETKEVDQIANAKKQYGLTLKNERNES